jgi:lauroyl/myristoyl acyltransferase
MDLNQQNVNLNYATPIVVADGNAVLLSDQGVPTLLFFQTRQQHDDHLHADVVAAVRLNNQQDLKNLAKAINDTIKKHDSREP